MFLRLILIRVGDENFAVQIPDPERRIPRR